MAAVFRYRDFDEALEIANDSPYGLQAGVFTRDLMLVRRALSALDFGGVMVNETPTFRTDNMPYGGEKDSGAGREGVRYAVAEMTREKLCVIRAE